MDGKTAAEIENAPTRMVISATTEPAVPPGAPLPASAPAPKKGLNLGTKFFVAAGTLLVVTVALAVALATVRANQIADATIRQGLKQAPNVYHVWRSNLDAQLKDSLHSIADDPGTKYLFDEGVTTETRVIWTKDKAAILKARTVFLIDRTSALIARNDRPEDVGRPFGSVKWVSTPLDTWQEVAATIREKESLASVACVPVIAGDKQKGEARLDGLLAATFTLDEQQAKTLKEITGGHVLFLANTARKNEPPKPVVSAATAGMTGADAFVAQLVAQPAAVKDLFEKGQEVGPLDLTVNGERLIAAAVPLKSASGEPLGAFVVARSRDAETAAFRQIRNTMAVIGLLAVLIAIPVTFAMGRRIARPLEQLAAGAVAIRDGQLDVKLPEGGTDEVGALARAFKAMVGELKEKAQLEKMLAELRNSPPAEEPTTLAYSRTTPGASLQGEMPAIGHLFAGRYKVLSVLGKGGMGSVFRAEDRELEEDVALKVLLPEAFEEGTVAVQTLKQEIKLARKITHPNVVRTHDLGETDGLRFLTMEYVPGTTLREVADRKGKVALAPGLQIAKQLCRGLAAVHEAGIIHRDIKPHNIMVLPNGVVKLMDFGIARVAEGADPTMAPGQTVGTPYYMSPEQARGGDLDVRSDIYSVGVVLYEIFAGERPIEGRDPLEVMRRHLTIEPRRPRELRPDLPDLLERIILACLAKDPARRPPNSNELYGALMRVAA